MRSAMKMNVSVIGAKASLRGSCTLPNGAATTPMPSSTRPITIAIRRSAPPLGRFARTTSFWFMASFNAASQSPSFSI